MRMGFLIAAALALVGLALIALRAGASDPHVVAVDLQQEEPTSEAATIDPLERVSVPGDDRRTPAPVREAPVAAPEQSFAIHIELVERGTDRPVPDVSLLLLPAGTRPGRAVEDARQRAVTDPSGRAFFGELEIRGPWDVYANPFDPATESTITRRSRRVGTLPALRWDSGSDRPVARALEIRLGARVELRSPLPRACSPGTCCSSFRASRRCCRAR